MEKAREFQKNIYLGRGTRDQIANILWNMEKARDFQKNIYFCFIDYAKAFKWPSNPTLGNIHKGIIQKEKRTQFVQRCYS